MAVNVFVSSHLRGYTQNKGELTAEGATLGEILEDLDRQYPGMRFRIIDEQNQVRTHINIYLNAEKVPKAGSLALPVAPGNEVHVIGALSGG